MSIASLSPLVYYLPNMKKDLIVLTN